MSEKGTSASSDMDLIRASTFLLLRWRVILSMIVLGGAIGLGLTLIVPVRYQASAIIEPGKVLGNEIEPLAAVAERMRLPSFFLDTTIQACLDSSASDPAQEVARMLKPSVERDSSFVTITARMKNKEQAQNCLKTVLENLRLSQVSLFELRKNSSESELRVLKQELARSEKLRDEELALIETQLTAAQKALVEAESFVEGLHVDQIALNASNDQFSASSLLISIVSQKEQEVLKLRDSILKLQSQVRTKTGLPETEKAIAALKLTVLKLEEQLQPALTRQAEFASPIFSPKNKVSPSRMLFTASGLLVGGLAALLLLVIQQFVEEFKRRRTTI